MQNANFKRTNRSMLDTRGDDHEVFLYRARCYESLMVHASCQYQLSHFTDLRVFFNDFDDLYQWFLTGVPRNYESRIFLFIIIMTLEEFYKIFQNTKFKYI